MAKIVRVHYPDITRKLLEQCLAKFYRLREIDGVRKAPSTSELIDWIGEHAPGHWQRLKDATQRRRPSLPPTRESASRAPT